MHLEPRVALSVTDMPIPTGWPRSRDVWWRYAPTTTAGIWNRSRTSTRTLHFPAAGRAEVQVPALGAAVGPFDPRRDDVRVARPDDALRLQPVQAGAHRALGQAGVTDQRGQRRERSGAARPGMIGQAHEPELARVRRPPATIGRNRRKVERQEIASTLTGHLWATHQKTGLWSRVWALFWSHSLPFVTVLRRPRAASLCWSRMLADGGERWCAVLESA
jgi:hypothetical protein